MKWKIVILAIIIVGLLTSGVLYYLYGQSTQTSGNNGTVVLTESGSTLLYPVFNEWAGNYTAAKITTQATGSGTGISSAIAGTVIIGATDAFMTNSQIQAHPMLNIPIMISSQYVAYNLPGLNNIHLNLTGPIIAGIYNNTIQYWNDPAIQKINPGINLPNDRIVPVRRSDGSGDTNMFTLFLSRSCQWWNQTVGYGTSVSWPSNPALQGANGNSGVISVMESTPYSIGYVAMTYTSQIAGKLGYAALLNRNGNYILPTLQTIMNAANQYLNSIPPDGRIGIAFAPGDQSYPIATFEYVVVKQVQSSSAIANALKAFLLWAVQTNGGSASQYLSPLYLIPLPSSVVQKVTDPIINQITG